MALADLGAEDPAAEGRRFGGDPMAALYSALALIVALLLLAVLLWASRSSVVARAFFARRPLFFRALVGGNIGALFIAPLFGIALSAGFLFDFFALLLVFVIIGASVFVMVR